MSFHYTNRVYNVFLGCRAAEKMEENITQPMSAYSSVEFLKILCEVQQYAVIRAVFERV